MRLNAKTLHGANAALPAYDRARVTPGIVQLGLGNFHRAHQAVYVDDGLADDPSWGILGVSLRRPDMSDALAPQDGLYTLAVQDAGGTRPRVVGSVLEALFFGEATAPLVARMADPAIRIVSLTLTEKGYCHDPATGDLNPDHPGIRADLGAAAPRTAPALIAAALAARRDAGTPPFTVLSCDNLPDNGRTAAKVVRQFAALRDDALAAWIEGNVAFPSTMVDRIVPATTDAGRAEIARLTGREDAWPVLTEPFTQWVIEDTFPEGRPAFPGAEFTGDVAPWEAMKLRMLNGAHSTLAYLGQLLGHAHVSDAIADPELAGIVRRLWSDEAAPGLSVEADTGAYADALAARFANPALKHRTAQIAMDGSQKVPQRLLGTIRDARAEGRAHAAATLGVAAWIEYATRDGAAPDDPLAGRFPNGGPPADRARAMLSMGEIFGDLGRDPAFGADVIAAVAALSDDPRDAVRATRGPSGRP